ncbi:MAG: periplasmic protein involved in polysaccharide export, partial [Bacteroidetes bacterium]|nr:periplasmic protein involved in polysaccharide export [Bacteroidota bacterium]
GLTKGPLTKVLRDSLTERKLLVDPVVSVRFLNYRITVIGEVGRPQVVNVSNDRVTILEALGLSGDITDFGNKENIMLIRESDDGTRTVKRLNLNDRSLLSSPYYYLRSNDIVYVEPTKAKVASTNTTRQILPLIISSISLVVIILDRLVIK